MLSVISVNPFTEQTPRVSASFKIALRYRVDEVIFANLLQNVEIGFV